MARRKGIPAINMADSNWREQLNDALQTSQPSTIIKPTIDLSKELEVRKDLSITDKDWTSETNESQDPFEC
jgi:hypothetical protein